MRRAFIETNGYPRNLVKSVLNKFRNNNFDETTETNDAPEDAPEEEERKTTLTMKVPYAGKTGENIVKNFLLVYVAEEPTCEYANRFITIVNFLYLYMKLK